MISYDDFSKIKIVLGEILSVERVEDSNKLLVLTVDMGEDDPRQIVSGISKFFPDIADLLGEKCLFVANLEPRNIMGFESQGMILAFLNEETGDFSLVCPDKDMPAGLRLG